jgi:predicted aldo/keto reductase-like oxidoreductase
MQRFPVQRTPAEWALQWLWDQPEVSVVLSGMSTMTQVEQNLHTADGSRIGAFSAAEHALIADVTEKYRARIAIPCSKCGYCMPCPNGVQIPANFEYFNYAHLYDDLPGAKFRYNVFLTEEQRSGACIACGVCEGLCPQKIEIGDWMTKVSAMLA